MFCLEELEFILLDPKSTKQWKGFKHVRYVSYNNEVHVFKTKKRAAQYYDNQPENIEMRALNAHNTWISDWHPKTKLKYRVVPYVNGLLP